MVRKSFVRIPFALFIGAKWIRNRLFTDGNDGLTYIIYVRDLKGNPGRSMELCPKGHKT